MHSEVLPGVLGVGTALYGSRVRSCTAPTGLLLGVVSSVLIQGAKVDSLTLEKERGDLGQLFGASRSER